MGAGVDGRPHREGCEEAGRRLVKWICYCSISRDCDTLAKKALVNDKPATCLSATCLAVYGIAFALWIAVMLP